jgi:putative transposase
MPRTILRDDQWERIRDLLPGKVTDCGVTAKDNRLFVEAVLWIARTGSPWRDLPSALGQWHTTYTRFSRWGTKGVWERVIAAVSDDADLETLFIDSTVVRAHQHAAGAQKKKARRPSGGRGAG